MPHLELRPFGDEHLEEAARLLAERHSRHREAEALLPPVEDFVAEIRREWDEEGASGAVALRGGRLVGYLVGRPKPYATGMTWTLAGIAGHAVEEPESARDVYAAAAERWVDEGSTRHGIFVPSFDSDLVDAWFRLCFGASAALATREPAPEPAFEANVEIRPGRPSDLEEAVRLERLMGESMLPAPSFSHHPGQPHEEALEEWRDTWDDAQFAHFVAERDGRIVGHILMYRRPRDLRVPENSIDLAAASTDPDVRGSGVGRALTAHVLDWACRHGYGAVTADWRMTNLWASRFWPRRGFRTTFLRLYRAIP